MLLPQSYLAYFTKNTDSVKLTGAISADKVHGHKQCPFSNVTSYGKKDSSIVIRMIFGIISVGVSIVNSCLRNF